MQNNNQSLAVVQGNGQTSIVSLDEWSANDVVRQVTLIQRVMKEAMKEGEHYGTIPGCGDKKSLKKSGAEKLGLTFRLAPEYTIKNVDLPNGHREYTIVCTLRHITSGQAWRQGVGICSTLESKYRFRNNYVLTNQDIPKDYKQKKAAYKAQGFVCKKDDTTGEWGWYKLERAEHDNPMDNYNTVLKMAKKRAHVDAMLSATAASDIFTQDLDELENGHDPETSPGSAARKKAEARSAKTSGKSAPKNTEPPVLEPIEDAEIVTETENPNQENRQISGDEWEDLMRIANTTYNPQQEPFRANRLWGLVQRVYGCKVTGKELTLKKVEKIKSVWFTAWQNGAWEELEEKIYQKLEEKENEN